MKNLQPLSIEVQDRWCQIDIFVRWDWVNDYISWMIPFNLPVSDSKLDDMIETQVKNLKRAKTLKEFEKLYTKYWMYPIDFRYI